MVMIVMMTMIIATNTYLLSLAILCVLLTLGFLQPCEIDTIIFLILLVRKLKEGRVE